MWLRRGGVEEAGGCDTVSARACLAGVHQVVRRTPSYGSDLDSLAEMCLGESVAGAYGSGSANGGYTEEQVQIKPHDGPSTNTRLAIQIIIACGTFVFRLSGCAGRRGAICAFDGMPHACTGAGEDNGIHHHKN
jgi:hypothetical protein